MKHLAVAANLLLATPVAAQSGDPITAENAVDVVEMIRIADAIDAAVDAKAWPLARSFFTETIEVDFTSLTGGEPATIPADALIDGWSGNLTAEKTSFHLRGNHRVVFDGAGEATLYSHGYAWNRMERGAAEENGGDPLWEVWGTYEHGFIRTEDGWQVDAMSFFATAQRGNDFVRDTPGS
ncbi:nuclear transport factor 2 family protein [Pontivivens ytuae]|uniref:Nuclear transport factor 2 family protein n=1 Tax=Pontivivens ytuae TaxID=2789856 RepID=A0A7S9LVC9_9RHOB|nr:nuclear transport factor 2 family protein [Pontivivens ytuae]QPH55410.1 nuclear transport factor 2 family protein [Pontivivens ytuae]